MTKSIGELKQHASNASRLLKALSNETRLLILCFISQGEMSVTDINQNIQISQSALSQHLAVLRNDGLVETRRDSQTIYYSLAKGPAAKIIETLHGIYCQ